MPTCESPPPDLVDVAVDLTVQENKASAGRWAAIHEFHAQALREREATTTGRPSHFHLTPLQATKVEFGPALGLHELTIQVRLDEVDALQTHFPGLWDRCLAGRLDLGRAVSVLEQCRHLANEDDIAEFAKLMEEFLDQHDDPAQSLCTIPRDRFQKAAYYRRLKFDQVSDETSFAEAFAKRGVRLHNGENGIGCLSAADGETRTLEQLRADVLLDLVHGRLTVGAGDADLEEDETAYGEDPGTTIARRKEIGGYAKPVINVTVPITTLMGVSNTPGVLSGGIPIPADLARLVAADPSSTWYRMLTDAARSCHELSVAGYQPSPPIAREVVARDGRCIYPGCCRPATRCELDHREEYPLGATCSHNLAPLCKLHHKVKHSDGFSLVRNDDGSYTVTTRTGHRYTTRPDDQPIDDWPDDDWPDESRPAA